MADRVRHIRTRIREWDARFRLASLPFSLRRMRTLAFGAFFCAVPAARSWAQGATPRPWLDWYSAETEHFVFHYPSAYRVWTLSLAERIESLRGQVAAIVGYAPARRVHIVVDDPINDPNGYAFTPLDAPTIVLWPVSPDPRSDIGDYAVWQELARDARVRAHRASHAPVAQSVAAADSRAVTRSARADRDQGAALGDGGLCDVCRRARQWYGAAEPRLARRRAATIRSRGTSPILRAAQRIEQLARREASRIWRDRRSSSGSRDARATRASSRCGGVSQREPTVPSSRRSPVCTAAPRRSSTDSSPWSSPLTPLRSGVSSKSRSSSKGRSFSGSCAQRAIPPSRPTADSSR